MVTIGILEDLEVAVMVWENAVKKIDKDFKVLWLKTFEECSRNLNSIDLLVVDRMLEIKGVEHDLFKQDLFTEIMENFKGPLIFSSFSTVPPRYKDKFTKISRDKKPPSNLKNLIQSTIFP